MELRMSKRSDDGFSLVEVVVAIFLLGLLSLGVLPLLIGGVRLSTENRTTVEATALAEAHLAALRAQFPTQPATTTTCADLQLAASVLRDSDTSTLPNIAVPTGFQRDVVVESCPSGAAAGKPAGMLVTITIERTGGGTLIVLRSRIPVSAA